MKKIIFKIILVTLMFTFVMSVTIAAEEITLTIMAPDMNWATVLKNVIGPQYERETGVKVITEIFPSIVCHTKIMIEISSGSDSYDIYHTDCIYTGEVMNSGGVIDLEGFMADPNLPKLNLDQLSSLSDAYCYLGDTRYGMVISETTPMFMYRKDLFEKYGIGEVKTWDDFYEAAKKLTLDVDGDGRTDIYGTVINMQEQDGGYSEFIYRLLGFKVFEDNDYILNNDGKPIFNNSKAIKALETLKSIMPFCPPDTLSYGYGEVALGYKQGKIAMVVSWQDQFKEIEDPDFSDVVGLNGYSVLPYFEEDRTFQGSVGGFQLFINKNSKHQEEAYKFFTWLAKGDAYIQMAEGGEPGVASIPYRTDPKMLVNKPYLGPWKDITNAYIIPVRFPEFTEIQRIVYEEVDAYLADRHKTAQEALDAAESRVNSLMESAGYFK